MKFVLVSESLASAKAKYGDLADELKDIDPTTTKKYLEFLCKIYENEEVEDYYAGTNDFDVAWDMVGWAIKKFDKIHQHLQKKDINQYKNYDEFINAVEKYSTRKEKRNAIRKIHPESEVIYENDKCIVIRVDSWEASQQYGAGKFCIAREDDDGYWEQYRDDGSIFFYMFKKDDIHRPYVMEMYWDENEDFIKLVGWDYGDNQMDADNLLDYFELDRKIFEKQIDHIVDN
jgi:hypothetical protein